MGREGPHGRRRVMGPRYGTCPTRTIEMEPCFNTAMSMTVYGHYRKFPPIRKLSHKSDGGAPVARSRRGGKARRGIFVVVKAAPLEQGES